MQTIGFIGGIAPASTIEYYRLLIEGYRARRPGGSDPSILINSIGLQAFLALVAEGDRPRLTDYLVGELARLVQAGADLGFFASNTPHLVFEEVAARCPIPLVSIVQATAVAAAAEGYRRVGLLGTRFTMEGGFYPEVLGRHGVDVVIPSPGDRSYVHDHYIGELTAGIFRAGTRDGMLAVIDRLRVEEGIDAVILGGTELPLLFREGAPARLPLLDTTRLHVEAVLARLLASEG